MTSHSHQVQILRSGHGTLASGLGAGAGALRDDVSTGLSCPTSTCTTTGAGRDHDLGVPDPGQGVPVRGWKGCNSSRPAGYPPPRPDVKARLCWISATTNVAVKAQFARLG